MTILQPVRGTRDFYPQEMRLRNWLFEIWRQTSCRFGFEESDACVLESEALYVRKAGDEITEQLYGFADKSERRLALRPEMTPSLARLILQRQNALSYPLKWFSIPQCFRYERMTRGRKREHYQWNLDIIGQPHPVAEVEVISALLTALRTMGLQASHVELRLNDRRILNALLEHLGVPSAKHPALLVIIDKREKISADALDQLLAAEGLNKQQLARLNAFFEAAQHSFADATKLLANAAPSQHLLHLQELLGQMGLGDYLRLDCTVVRGLSYYTGTVFELGDRSRAFRAICGGGRYDSLLSHYGGKPMPAIGFGFGDVVIMELLESLGLVPELSLALDYAMLPFSEKELTPALQIAQQLRQKGLRVGTDFGFGRLKRALQRAAEMGARKAVLIMPDELQRDEVVVRDLDQRGETRMQRQVFLANA